MKFLGIPKVQFFDSNGEPLTGGKLHSYEPGTTTNKDTYATIAEAKTGTNPNSNPIILDSRGEADVVLVGNTKLILKDSDDNVIWTMDNIDDDGTIIDENGNFLLDFTQNSSAVNYFTIHNAASGDKPRLEAKGDDSNIDIELLAKGTGTIVISGTSTSSAEIRLKEDTDNGTNYVGIKAPSAVTTSQTYTLPSSDGNSGNVLVTDGAGTLSFSSAGAGIDWTNATDDFLTTGTLGAGAATVSSLTTSGTADTGDLTVTGDITVTGTVDGRDVATDGTKLDGIESNADVTDETNVTDALDGATLTAVTVATGDKVLIQDISDLDNLKTVTAQSIADLAAGGGGGGGTLVQSVISTYTGTTPQTTSSSLSSTGFTASITPTSTSNKIVGHVFFMTTMVHDGSSNAGMESGYAITRGGSQIQQCSEYRLDKNSGVDPDLTRVFTPYTMIWQETAPSTSEITYTLEFAASNCTVTMSVENATAIGRPEPTIILQELEV